MTDKTAIATTDDKTGEVAKRETTVARVTVKPKVDIYEDANGVTLYADMPGVAAGQLDISVEKNRLTISGESNVALAEGVKARYAEFRNPRYVRHFTLNSDLDQDKIEANMVNGVLTLSIAKTEAVKPRKIEVKTTA